LADYRFLAPVVVLVGLFLLAPVASASHIQCGDSITQDTTLDGDLACPGNGLIVLADNEVTIDLAGHTIAGAGSGTGIESFFKLQLRNGTVRNFGAGIYTEGRLVVDHMVFEQNGAGVVCHYATPCIVEDNVFRQNGSGLNLLSADQGGTTGVVRRNGFYDNDRGASIEDYSASVTRNVFAGNGQYGIQLDYHAEGEMTHNRVVDGDGAGVVITYGSQITLRSNLIAHNDGDGVALSGGGDFGHTRADIDHNSVTRNGGDGVSVRGLHLDAAIYGNRVDRNGDDGIDVYLVSFGPGCCDITVQGNRAFFNADLGIEAAPPAMDGGGNRAKHNGNPAQCVGVRCK
jgi:hypothetical protein